MTGYDEWRQASGWSSLLAAYLGSEEEAAEWRRQRDAKSQDERQQHLRSLAVLLPPKPQEPPRPAGAKLPPKPTTPPPVVEKPKRLSLVG